MKLNEYQELANRTVNSKLEPVLALAVSGLGVAGEAGEVADIIKKYAGHGHDLDLSKLKKELGDTLWYVAVISKQVGLTMEDVAQTNIDKLKARYPEGFSEEASKNRQQGDT